MHTNHAGQCTAARAQKTAFVPGALAWNEIDRDYAYDRHLCKRLRTGCDRFNPELALRRSGNNGEGWVSVFSLLNLPLIKELADPRYDRHIDDLLKLANPPPTSVKLIVPRTKLNGVRHTPCKSLCRWFDSAPGHQECSTAKAVQTKRHLRVAFLFSAWRFTSTSHLCLASVDTCMQ